MFSTPSSESDSGFQPYFNEDYWEVADDEPWSYWNNGSWFVGKEEAGESHNIILRPVGGWEVGFRPTTIRITHNFADADTIQNDFILHNTCTGSGCPTWVAQDGNLVSGEEKDCFFDGYDISRLRFETAEEYGPWSIINIEFSEE